MMDRCYVRRGGMERNFVILGHYVNMRAELWQRRRPGKPYPTVYEQETMKYEKSIHGSSLWCCQTDQDKYPDQPLPVSSSASIPGWSGVRVHVNWTQSTSVPAMSNVICTGVGGIWCGSARSCGMEGTS